MAEDEKKDLETSDPTPDEDAGAAGPVAAGDPPPPPVAKASSEEVPPTTPPAAEAEATETQDEAPEEEAAQGEASEEDPPTAPAAEQKEEQPKAAEKKKDIIPGADLEPIAVEPDERPVSAEEQARREAEEEERRQREAAVLADSDEDAQPASRAPAKIDGDKRFLATGKRKRSIARVTLLPGGGKIEVNGRPLEEFFPRPLHQTIARQPLATTGYEGNVDVRVRVHGGGISGQAGAVRHGIARALIEVDPDLRGELKRRGFLTRDARVKERRKAGLKKARKRPQFSKR
jgi:small subunit ribosomal protein S9